MKSRIISLLVLTSAFGLGCGAGVDGQDHIAHTQQAMVEDNGRELNGRELNGRELNGRELNGRELNGRELNGRELNDARLGGTGGELKQVWLQGSELWAQGSEGDLVHGDALVGAILASDGSRYYLRIDGVAQGTDDQSDVWRYMISYRRGEQWEPLCADANGNPLAAIPLAGRWNYSRGVDGGGDHIDEPGVITFACEEAALAKCVEFGYAPWRGGPGPMETMHEACTRMVRADYCGDGRSFTRDGTPINIYDGYGIQADTEHWEFEAEWNADGARCMDARRIAQQTTPLLCGRSLQDASCGSLLHFATGTLLMDEFVPRPNP